jgi:uroporphyrinogen III methyltransferase/synthase
MTALAETLVGRRILLTRSEDDCAEWADEIAQRGAEAVLLPCIRSETIDTPELRAALDRALADADWIVFTSRRGVEAFEQLRRSPLPARARVAVVGAATAAIARARLGRADLVGRGTGAALAAELAADGALARQARVLIAVAENAGGAVEETLAAAGARCTRLDLYRTIPAPPAAVKRRLSTLRAEHVVLASPSAARGFVHQVDLDVPAAIYTIGPSTTAAARALGLTVAAEAREPSLEGILEAMQ